MRTAILIVSFGTSYENTRKKTIEAVENEIRGAYPEYPVYRAWTSRMIIRKVRERDNLIVDTVSEALDRMAVDGVERVLVQPTHVIPGIENERMLAELDAHAKQFASILVGEPLLNGDTDIRKLIRILNEEYQSVPATEALVFMGHGTEHAANEVYASLQRMLITCGMENWFVGTVEGSPSFADIREELSDKRYKKIHLAPLMLVAGDHACNDLAGDDEDSWKSVLMADGFLVECHLRGLGEMAGVRRLFREHLDKIDESGMFCGVCDKGLL